ncbi:MAG: phage tail sheath subtilisin-like domain-containing protein [Verrucomicrobiales bacterium]|nr:phage tail sheath subtilisin-like domain-containing protein [Verrucomicrobiales bacterium]MCP5527845.1 phage tail sheath subtilisin-like domain-containing protein [Verrucomicrobiales bacterium]
MPTYKTPDVYVEEISVLPRSVAEVATAIPAFVGYTEKDSHQQVSLVNKPRAVASLVEFESIFGRGPVTEVTELILDSAQNVVSATFDNKYYLYESIRLYFANGGARVYIVSAGRYRADGNVERDALADALDALRKCDEPTMLLAPDAISLSAADFAGLQQAMLKQCGELKDRFALLDLREADGWEAGKDAFRTDIGTKYLSYGAAYTPHLKSSMAREISYREVSAVIGNIRNQAESSIQEIFRDLDRAVADVDAVVTADDDLEAAYGALREALLTELNATAPDLGDAQTAYRDLFEFLYNRNRATIDAWIGGAGLHDDYEGAGVSSVRQAVRDLISDSLADTFAALNGLAAASDVHTDTTDVTGMAADAAFQPQAADWTAGEYAAGLASPPAAGVFIALTNGDAAERLANIRRAEAQITRLFYEFAQAVGAVIATAETLEQTLEQSLVAQFPLYASVVRGIGSRLQTVPPGGAVAGCYAYTDFTRGVWKAPANVSVDSVGDVTEFIDAAEQEDLNVDTTAGKSINAIRPFTGRGILIWGARTLAGNDNEWRYVPVRRFFIMVEESLRKSTLWAVFEPNDANLWVKLKSMIENYLIEKWRDGALAGAKPEDAFFVNVGLGTTMTSVDILEGRLIIEIGMAVVRPAEFIVLRFSHKMQTS